MKDRRIKFRQGLSSLYLPYYDALCGLLMPEWQPYSGFRTPEEQTALYMKGREIPGSRVTNAKAWESPHNYGCGSDWCLWDPAGVPWWPSPESGLWAPYRYAIEKVGLKAGADWGDFPHNELSLACSWRHILIAYQQGGMTAAQQKIEVALG